MAIELEKRELRSYELRKKKYKQRITMIIIFAILVSIIAGTFIIKQILDKNYNNYEVVHTEERKDSTSAKYISYKSGMVRYSRDGAMAFSSNGTMLWNGTYEMKDPIIDICEEYVVIADRGYKQLQIFNEKGMVSTISVLNTIKQVEVANQGVVAVLLDGDGTDRIQLYKEDGTLAVDIRTTNNKDGYPIDISLSNDGRKLATSYVFLNNGVTQNKLTFYNLGNVGQNYVDKIVGSYDFGQTIIPDIEFVNNDTLCAFGDNKVSVYKMKEKPSLLFEKTFDSEIKSIMYSDTYIGAVLNNLDSNEKHQILIYDLEGNMRLKYNDNLDYDRISISGKDIIMANNTSCFILTIDGKKKFKYSFDKNILYLFPVNNQDKYIIIDDLNMEEIKLIEE